MVRFDIDVNRQVLASYNQFFSLLQIRITNLIKHNQLLSKRLEKQILKRQALIKKCRKCLDTH